MHAVHGVSILSETTFQNSSKTRVLRQAGLDTNLLGENRPRSIDPGGSQPAVPKTDFEKFGHLPDTAENKGFKPNRAQYEPSGGKTDHAPSIWMVLGDECGKNTFSREHTK